MNQFQKLKYTLDGVEKTSLVAKDCKMKDFIRIVANHEGLEPADLTCTKGTKAYGLRSNAKLVDGCTIITNRKKVEEVIKIEEGEEDVEEQENVVSCLFLNENVSREVVLDGNVRPVDILDMFKDVAYIAEKDALFEWYDQMLPLSEPIEPTLHVPKKPIYLLDFSYGLKITVSSLTGRQDVIHVPAAATVRQLMMFYCKMTGLGKPSSSRLIFQHRQLEICQTLAESGVADGAVIRHVYALRGD